MTPVAGDLFVFSAPSGAGKTSLVKALLQSIEGLSVSVSHTTRPPRPGETDAVDYHFVDQPTFRRLVAEGGFIEYAEVFGNYYGTHEEAVRRQLASGLDVILEIDWQGAQQIRSRFPEAATVFILPPSVEALRERLTRRGQDSNETIEARMNKARSEMAHWQEYDYIIINDRFEQALAELEHVIRARRCRRQRKGRLLPEALFK
jgi:guanylate kinase